MIIALACLITVGVIFFILAVRAEDLPPPEPVSPFQHLDERKAAIYENLRDLQFEYRVGKLSDQDYQQTKQDLQKELAGVLAEIDRLKQTLAGQVVAAPASRRVWGTRQEYLPGRGSLSFVVRTSLTGLPSRPRVDREGVVLHALF